MDRLIVIGRINAYATAAPLRKGAVSVGLLAAAALALPALGSGSTGGAGLNGTGKHATNGAIGTVQPGDVTVSASGSGITVSTRISGFLHQGLRFTGSVPVPAGGEIVEIQRNGRQTGWQWRPTAHGTAASNGSFVIVWNANHIGRFAFRVLVKRRRTGRVRALSPSVQATIFRLSIATWYGPGLYGNSTACGEKLTPHLLGVANRTLPCGTPVEFYWQGRTIVVPVIDRGPYANGADWDLTRATENKLGSMPGIATVGAVSLPGFR